MKKLLALILSLSMVLSLGTAYAEDKTEELPNSGDMVFATTLGIIDENADQTAPLTRIELASVFYNIIMSGVEPYMDNSKYFSDVDFSMTAYADFVFESKIMNGIGNGLFAPDANVTYAQICKTVVAFLGYSEVAETKGGYPYGYITVAQSLGIIESAPESIDSVVTVNMLASVLRLSSVVPLMEQISFGSETTKYEINKNSNYLETYMAITRIQGVVTANYLADFEDYENLKYDQIKVDDKLFYITETSDEIINHLGCEVDIYVKAYGAGKKNSIAYFELCDSNSVIVIDSEDMLGLFSNKIGFCEGEKERYAKLAPDAMVIFNGSLALSYDNTIINPFKDSLFEGDVRLIDNNDDGTYEVVIVDAYKSYVVKNVVGNVIFNEFVPEDVVDLGNDFEDGDIEITNILGEPIRLAEIEEGDVINVSNDLKGQTKRIVVTINTYTGTLKEIDYSNNKIYIDGHEFKISKNLTSRHSLELGTKITVYFNKGRKISDIRVGEDKYRIGYLVERKITSGLSPEYRLQIFTSASEFEGFRLAEKVELSAGNRVSAQDAYNALPVDTSGSVRQPIIYTVDSNGDINWFDWSRGTQPRDGLYMIEGFDGTPQSLYFKSSQYNFESKLLLDSSTVIFNVPKDDKADDYDNYYIETVSYYGGDGKRNIDFAAYAIGEEGSPCAAIIVDKDGVKTSVPSSANLFVVDEISAILDAEGEECYKITVWDYSSGIHSIVAEKSIVDAAYPDALPQRGDILQTRSFNGVVKAVQFAFDFKTKKFKSGNNPSTATFESDLRCVYGDVVYNDGSFIKVRVEDSDEVLFFPLSNAKFVEVDFSESPEGILRSANSSCIYDTENYPSYSSKVVVRTNKGATRTIVVYNGLGGANR